MDQQNNQSAQSTQSVREKVDIAWNHFTECKTTDGKKQYKCLYCGIIYKGGGIHRMKQHLAGIKGNIASCKKVPHDIRHQMQQNLIEISKKKQQAQQDLSQIDDLLGEDPVEEERGSCSVTKSQSSDIHGKGMDKGKRKIDEIDNFFAPRTKSGSQPSLKSVMASKEAVHRADLAIARWFYDSCIPFNAINSPFAQKAIDAVAAIGPGYKLPSYHRLRVNLLRDAKEECKLLIESYIKTWKETGCTLMADGWTDTRNRTLINFLVYCPRGVSFLKSVDASDVIKDATTLCSLFTDIVEWVGPENIVHFITDNAANYKKAGELLHEKYGNIYWSPCAAHCINLILKDIGSMPYITELARKASKVTIFIYNHAFILAWLRKRKGWTEIVRPGLTRFVTTFITLRSVHDHKHDLQAFVTNKAYIDSKLSKTMKGKEAASIILDANFWNDSFIISKLSGPLIRLLRIVDADEKPSLGYLYDGMFRARKAMKTMFRNNKRMYKPFTSIIKRRWDNQLRQGIHSAAYFLNPQFQYDRENYCSKSGVLQGLVELIGNKDVCPKSTLAMNEVRFFRDSLESFGKLIASTLAKEMQPDEWWRMFGSSAPNLQKLAIRILSQTSSSSDENNLSNICDEDDIPCEDVKAFGMQDFDEEEFENPSFDHTNLVDDY
ncbi:hypothetical protein KFK09_022205 [Dendrobium nobile]|uniref:BED-type domain-containing protein n=1 Tax=Dendrobium nobile TaxID=94219 RepID=A0A8T3AIC2_DENNO|nr:hypothetical protein KFK09_022205 [Dendrobium nobile]